MDDKDYRKKALQEIEKKYIVSVSGGQYNTPSVGSFFATSEDGREFHANKALVEKKSELFKMLSKGIRLMWILVEDEIWGKKWGDIRMPEIIKISEHKNECEEYKANLLLALRLQFEYFDLAEQQIKYYKNPDWKPDDDKEKQFEREEAVLREKLELIKKKLEDE